MGQYSKVYRGRLMKSQSQETLLMYLAIKAFLRKLWWPSGVSLKWDMQSKWSKVPLCLSTADLPGRWGWSGWSRKKGLLLTRSVSCKTFPSLFKHLMTDIDHLKLFLRGRKGCMCLIDMHPPPRSAITLAACFSSLLSSFPSVRAGDIVVQCFK